MKHRKADLAELIIAHGCLLCLLFSVITVPKSRQNVKSPGALICGIIFLEIFFLFRYFRQKKRNKRGTGPLDRITLLWVLLIVWEFYSSITNKAQPVIVPCPENVAATFVSSWKIMLLNVAYSMKLLLLGFVLGLFFAVVLGLIAGWIERVREFALPIANVMAPIPAIVISPYLVTILPSFQSASLAVIILGVFWPNFLSTVHRIQRMDREIMDSARMLKPGTFTMLTKIIFPYLLPGIVNGLKVSLTTSMLMLNFAELMGATKGMGFYVQNSIAYANYTQAVAGIFVIGGVVTLLSFLTDLLQKIIIRWT